MALREILASFGVQVDTSKLAEAHAKLEAAKGSAGNFGKALSLLAGVAKAAAATGIALAVKATVGWFVAQGQAADAMGEAAAKAQMSARQFQIWSSVAQDAGGSVEAITQATRVLSKNLFDSAGGSKQSAETLKALGIAAKSADGSFRDTSEVFGESIIKLADVADTTKRAALAQRLLGRSATELLPLMSQGSAALKEQIELAKEFGVVYSEETIAAGDKLATSMHYLGLQFQRLKGVIAAYVFAPLAELALITTRVFSGFASLIENTKFVQSALLVLGGLGLYGLILKFSAVASVIGGKVLPYLKLLNAHFVKIVIPLILIEDLLGFLEGRNSVIGTLLEKFGLLDPANRSAEKLRNNWKDIVENVKKAVPHIKLFAQQTILGIAAIFDYATAKDEEAGARFQAFIIRNTDAIGGFFDAVLAGVGRVGAEVWMFIPRMFGEAFGSAAAAAIKAIDTIWPAAGEGLRWLIGKFVGIADIADAFKSDPVGTLLDFKTQLGKLGTSTTTTAQVQEYSDSLRTARESRGFSSVFSTPGTSQDNRRFDIHVTAPNPAAVGKEVSKAVNASPPSYYKAHKATQ